MANKKDWNKSALEELICEGMQIRSITPTIRKQINNFVILDNMTYKEIARCIVYYNEIMLKELEPIYGIAFVPAVRDRAAKYFAELELKEKSKKEQADKIVEFQENNIIFNIKSLGHKKRKPKQLDISEINVKGESDDD